MSESKNNSANHKKPKLKVVRIIFAVLGLICFGLGTVGIFLPILPTTPLYLATLFFFTQSSQRLHDWFIGTNLYKKTSGILCEKSCHDYENETDNHVYSDDFNGSGIYHDEKSDCRKNYSGSSMGIPYSVFLYQNKDYSKSV